MRTTIIINDKKYNKLKELSYRNKQSLGQLINQAVDDVYFSPKRGNFKSLRGICQGANITEAELEAVKIKFKEI